MPLTRLPLTTGVSGTLPIGNGGTNVTTAADLANTGNMVLLHETNVTSNTASVSIDGHFSSDYKRYQLVIDNYEHSGDNKAIVMRANIGGTANSSTIYDAAGRWTRQRTDDTTSGTNLGDFGDYSFMFIGWVNGVHDGSNRDGYSAIIDIFNPETTTRNKRLTVNNVYYGADNSYEYVIHESSGFLIRTISALSGFTIFPQSVVNISNADIKLYGVK